MAKHVHIYFPAKKTKDQAPGSVPAAKKTPLADLVDRLLQAIARNGGTKDAAGFEESKHKRDEGGKFSSTGGSAEAAMKHHGDMAAKHQEAAKKEAGPKAGDPNFQRTGHALAAQLHENAASEAKSHLTHGTPYEHYHGASEAAAAESKALGVDPSHKGPKGNPGSVPPNAIHPDLAAVTKPGMPTPGSKESPKGEINELTGMPMQKQYSDMTPEEKIENARAVKQRIQAKHAAAEAAKKQPATAPAKPSAAPAEAPAGAKPTKATAKGGKAGAHELLSTGHPFSIDELMAATGVSNKATIMTALSDLKNPKYAGAAGALNIVKRPDGSYHVAKSDGKPAGKLEGPMSGPSGSLPTRVGPDGKDVGNAQNTQARIDAKSVTPMSAHGEAKGTMHLKANPNAKLDPMFGKSAPKLKTIAEQETAYKKPEPAPNAYAGPNARKPPPITKPHDPSKTPVDPKSAANAYKGTHAGPLHIGTTSSKKPEPGKA